MGGNESASAGVNSSDAAIQLHSPSFTSIWLPCWLFPAGFLGLMAVPEESYQSSYDFTV